MKDETSLLFEVSGEVCFRMGGIHTVISSKIPYVRKQWGNRHFLIGALIPAWDYEGHFQEAPDDAIDNDMVRDAVRKARDKGIRVHMGYWLVEGKPLVILLDPYKVPDGIDQYKSAFLAANNITPSRSYDLVNLYISFGYCLECFFKGIDKKDHEIIVHFHEYMTTVAITEIRKLNIKTVFTTHATTAGRYLAAINKSFHHAAPETDWKEEVKKISGYCRFCMELEQIAARECDIFTTVSPLTAAECLAFLNRSPDVITPNGLNIRSVKGNPAARAEDIRKYIQKITSLHLSRKEVFAKSNGLPPKKTFYFFTSGRYEYTNKGFDLIVGALAKLNRWIARSGNDISVVMFFITDMPYTLSPPVVQWMRRLKNALLYWRGADIFLYKVPRHLRDCLLARDIARSGLLNRMSDRVKILYHPQFLSLNSPSLKINYPDFIRGCDLGIFPSYYEPWGYTPEECISAGVPAVTSNMTGFGQYIAGHTEISADSGVFLLDWSKKNMINDLFGILREFILNDKEYRTELEEKSEIFDWENMISGYDLAYEKAGHTSPVHAA